MKMRPAATTRANILKKLVAAEVAAPLAEAPLATILKKPAAAPLAEAPLADIPRAILLKRVYSTAYHTKMRALLDTCSNKTNLSLHEMELRRPMTCYYER